MRNFSTYQELHAALELAPLMPGAFRFAKQYAPATFTCARCSQHKPLNFEGCSTGYGVSTQEMVNRGHVAIENAMVCFQCCGETDLQDMRDEGKAVLYLTHPPIARNSSYPFADGKVTNWPGTLSIPCRVKRGHHNIAGSRYDVWFRFEGYEWHGVQCGEGTQICRCKRTKTQVRQAA